MAFEIQRYLAASTSSGEFMVHHSFVVRFIANFNNVQAVNWTSEYLFKFIIELNFGFELNF
jgi:hypothetical protein